MILAVFVERGDETLPILIARPIEQPAKGSDYIAGTSLGCIAVILCYRVHQTKSSC